MQIKLSDPQFEFVTAEDQFPAFVGGFGAGKTYAGTARALARKLQYPKLNVAYYMPTYDLVKLTGFPMFSAMLEEMGLPYKVNRNDAVIDLDAFGKVIFRTMDNPERIVAYEVADSIVDELDTLPTDKARNVWEKVLGRNRQKKHDGALNTVAVATTPEGFRFVYQRWKKEPAPGYRLIKAKTDSNAKHLPVGYIQSLRDSYPSNRLAAYLDGEFVNLTSGTVYTEYDRTRNGTAETIMEREPLHVGMDFNVGKMAAIVHVLRDGKPRAVKEYTDVLDTPAMIALLKARHPEHKILVYPDASGKSRKSVTASQSDLALLRDARFTVCVNQSNPAVKDRVLAMNRMFASGDYRVNADECPVYAECLEQQAYDRNGEPDKQSGLDHPPDAGGYFIAYRFPVVKRAAIVQDIAGFV